MLEGLVAWVLNTYLGEYVENLNTYQLSIGIFQGNAELENLPLKKSALKSFGIPLEIKSGLIGKVKLQIPVHKLQREQWAITIEDVYLVAGPIVDQECDTEADEKLRADKKKAQLAELEENFKLQKQYLNQSGTQQTNAWSWWTYGTSFITNIIDNFQLQIKNVNLRYEDDTSLPGIKLACGVSIQSMSARSAGSDWVPGFSFRGSDNNIYKIVDLQNFAVYWDSSAQHFNGNTTRENFKEFFDSQYKEMERKQCYLLAPVSGTTKLLRNDSSLPLRRRDTPRIWLDICLDEFPLSFNDLQFRQMHAAMKAYDFACKVHKYKRFKKSTRFCKDASATSDVVAEDGGNGRDNDERSARFRWMFAINCILHEARERWRRSSRDFLLARARDNVSYVKSYDSCLVVGAKYISKADKEFMERFESETPIDELKILRLIVTDRLLEKEKEHISSKSQDPSPAETPTGQSYGVLKSWFPGWGGWYGSPVDDKAEGAKVAQTESPTTPTSPSLQPQPPDGKKEECETTKSPRSEFDEDLAGMFTGENSLILMDTVFLRVNFKLRSGSLKLNYCSSDTGEAASSGTTSEVLRPLLVMESRDIETTFESRARVGGWMVAVSMLDFVLVDKFTVGSVRPTIVSPLNKNKNGNENSSLLFKLCLEKKPFFSKANYKLSISSEPLDIVYNPHLLEKVKRVFSVGSDVSSVELDIAVVAKQRYEVLKRQTKHELKHTIDAILKGNIQSSSTTWIVNVDLFAPHITLLENFTSPTTPVVVFDLGHLRIQNKSRSAEEVQTSSAVENEDEEEYFATPSSTPQELDAQVTGDVDSVSQLNESIIHETIYEIYTIDLTDLKMFVCRANENWSAVYSNKAGPWHMINKFSVSLLFERRLIKTENPDWPNVIISGSVPSIDLHVDEFKLAALNKCLDNLSNDIRRAFKRENVNNPSKKGPSVSQQPCAQNSEDGSDTGVVVSECKLVSMEFSILNLSLDVHRKGHSVGQLRVSQVSSDIHMTESKTKVFFAVKSLIVADALQTSGHDYELLVASHSNFKHILSPSGEDSSNLKSEVTLPPQPSSSSASPLSSCYDSAKSKPTMKMERSPSTASSKSLETTEALIRLSVEIKNKASRGEPHYLVDFDFNSLDVIANQRTIFEVMAFFKLAFPAAKVERKTHQNELSGSNYDFGLDTSKRVKLQSKFGQLNVMFLSFDGERARKVALVTFADVQIDINSGPIFEMNGCLNGFQLKDLTRSNDYKIVLQSGIVPSDDQSSSVQSGSHDAVFNSSLFNEGPPSSLQQHHQQSALSFSVVVLPSSSSKAGNGKYIFEVFKKSQSASKVKQFFNEAEKNRGQFDCHQLSDHFVRCHEGNHSFSLVGLKLASVKYLHTPKFVLELSQCLVDFREYLHRLGSSISAAATELAAGLVKMERQGTSLHGGKKHNLNSELIFSPKKKVLSDTYDWKRTIKSWHVTEGSLDFMDSNHSYPSYPNSIPPFPSATTTTTTAASTLPLKSLVFVTIIDSPVLVFPKRPESSEVLSCHLGTMVFSNFSDIVSFPPAVVSGCNSSQVITIESTNMSVYSLDLNHQSPDPPTPQHPTSHDLPTPGFCVLHDTGFTVSIHLTNQLPDDSLTCEFASSSRLDTTWQVGKCFVVDGKLSPLKVVFTKKILEQIIKTLDNIAPEDCGKQASDNSANIRPSRISFTPSFSSPTKPPTHVNGNNWDGLLLTNPDYKERDDEDQPDSTNQMLLRFSAGMQSFEVLLKSESGNDIARLTLHHFSVDVAKASHYFMTEMKLDSLLMEGLLDGPSRILMASYGSPRQKSKKRRYSGHHDLSGEYLSQSCPTSMIDIPLPDLPPSLPSSFHSELYSALNKELYINKRLNREKVSPKLEPTENYLVFIKVFKVDKKCPHFRTHHKNVNYKLSVDFKCLETFVHLETWVLLLEFLGMGGKAYDPELFTRRAQQFTSSDSISQSIPSSKVTAEKDQNVEIDLHIQHFSVTLDKKQYELAKFDVSEFVCHVLKLDNNLKLDGHLGGMSIFDLSPAGHLYSEKFKTTGFTALSFQIFKYGTPDPDMMREYDVCVSLEMSSVHYVHTHRFFQELLAFIQNFNQFQDLLNRSRAASEGIKIAEHASHNARIQLSINAGAPVLFIPMSSKTTEVLVLDFGKLKIQNRFLFSRPEGLPSSDTSGGSQTRPPTLDPDLTKNLEKEASPTFSPESGRKARSRAPNILSSLFSSLGVDGGYSSSLSSTVLQQGLNGPALTEAQPTKPVGTESKSRDADDGRCLLDVMDVRLFDVEVLSAEWKELSEERYEDSFVFASFALEKQSHKILKEKCHLHLHVERNLDGDFNKSVSDLNIKARLSSVKMALNSRQYKLIRGILAHNFGEQLDEFQYQVMSHLKDPKTHSILSGEPHVTLSITVALDNVRIELIQSAADSPNHSSSEGSPGARNKQKTPHEVSLALVDLVKSSLHFESRSDQSKDVGLVCHEINFVDTRYLDAPMNVRPNVFSAILKPSDSGSEKTAGPGDALRLEVRCRMNRDYEKYHILLNNMRMMGIFDWLLAAKNFLMMSPEDPFAPEKERKAREAESQGMFSTCSGSILTKRISVIDGESKRKLEFTLNMCDTELVIVEDAADRDTNAVIIKGTTVIVYKPDSDRPLSCSLQNIEVFSCCLAAEDETALSIIDPMLLTLELNNTVVDKNLRRTAGLLEATQKERKIMPVLEVSFQVLSIRLSYNDIRLFTSIINSMPKQVLQASRASNTAPPKSNDVSLTKLQELGFSMDDSLVALKKCHGHLDEAAHWLTSYVSPVKNVSSPSSSTHFFFSPSPSPSSSTPPTTVPSSYNSVFSSISGFELKEGTISICLIDDCLDADVPLGEIILSDLYVLHNVIPHPQGKAHFKLYGDYYNRSLSGWEPFLEKWGCNLEWQKGVVEEEGSIYVDIKGATQSEVFNLNLTRTLLDLYSKTFTKWIDDFNNQTQYNSRRRVPFIPYALRNQVGCNVYFTTVSTSPSRHSYEVSDELSKKADEWTKVTDGTEMSFLVAEREKIRHKDSHELTVHQLALKVDGWKDVAPVSVDKVGTFFRHADPDIDSTPKIFQVRPSARLVFDVAIEGSARKVITVRSALVINNLLNDHIEVKLESLLNAKVNIMRIKPMSKSFVPLHFVSSKMWVRPSKPMVDWSLTPVNWQSVGSPGARSNVLNACRTTGTSEDCYRFCVSVERQNYPPDDIFQKSTSPTTPQPSTRLTQPGHMISILPPMRVVNLLPIEINCALKHVSSPWMPRVSIRPGKVVSISEIDLSKDIALNITFEGFPKCQDLIIPVGTSDNKVLLVVCDNRDRPLSLNVAVKAGLGGALKVSISSPYWLVNKSGLPLIFKQHESTLAAGQFAEHEIARSVTPLLFSFSDKTQYELCTMRLGSSVHGEGSTPVWCPRFMLERGVTVRQVRVARGSRPDWIYNIGIEVRQGKGRYSDTSIVTFTPRYQLDNRTSHKLAFAQGHQTLKQDATQKYLCSLPNCVLPFHWPRVDFDTLLCIRVMEQFKCHWSGGFQIDKVDSFHINMRTEQNSCFFIHVDIILLGATFFVIFSDAVSMPPPYRIDNFAEVPVVFYQAQVDSQRLQTCVKPKTSMPYAWDEPTMMGCITVRVPSGTSATYDMKKLGDSERLCYENFIYIAFSHTFKSQQRAWSLHPAGRSSNHHSQELVLDVVSPGMVVLKRKEAGKRSQLWRMTSKGLLEHEGSSAPKDPGRKKNSPFSSSSSFSSLSSSTTVYVLDIKDIALQPTREMTLTIRKPDEKRVSTQTWRFVDGYLCCGDKKNLCIQAKDGHFGLRDGGEAILGPRPQSSSEIPPEMSIHREKLQPGSGFLCVKVINDGPTRVLQITDVTQQRYEGETMDDWVMVHEKRKKPELRSGAAASSSLASARVGGSQSSFLSGLKLEVSFNFPGLGVSLVDETPQELIYVFLKGVHVECSLSDTDQVLQVDVKDFQIDNQLHGTPRPILVFVPPPSKRTKESEIKPVLHICAHKVSSHNWNAQIFKQFLISVKPFNVQIEERILWHLLRFLRISQDAELDDINECQFASARSLMVAALPEFRRYYFGMFKIFQCCVSLSVLTASDLAPDLKKVKKSLRIPLIRFEDAQVELDSFTKYHLFETFTFLVESIRLHYMSEILGQAAKILGSVDFLGNPLGLFSDMAEGVQCLLEGNVGGLLKNVTKGATNSVAKVSGTLSDTVGKVTMDKRHQVERQQILQQCREGGTDHLIAGLNSLWHGLFGAVVSIPTQAYHGASERGIAGFASGFAKGVVGTFTKPVAGVLDLTSGAANAIRDTSKGYYHKQPLRVREPRCCYGRCGLLPPYSAYHAEAQEFLFQQNHNVHSEMFVARYKLQIGSESESVHVLISNKKIYFMKKGNTIIFQVPYDYLIGCQWMNKEDKCYIRVVMKDDSSNLQLTGDAKKSPLVRCDSESIAEEVVQHIRYAKNLYNEIKQTLPPSFSPDD